MQTAAAQTATNVVQIKTPAQDLAEEYVRNKAQLDALTERNREIARNLADLATYKEGCDTGHLTTSRFKITAARKLNEKWDQKQITGAVRSKLGEQLFGQLFAAKYEPRKKDLDAFLRMAAPEFTSVIHSARTVSPGQPQIKVEEV